MEGFILGIDLCNDYCRVSALKGVSMEPTDISFMQADGRQVIQTAVGKKHGLDEWLIGKDAYESVLTREGFVADKLLARLISKDGVQAGDIYYTAEELMTGFIRTLLDCARKEMAEEKVERLVFSLQKVDIAVIDALIQCTDALGISREQVHIVSHTEAFLYSVLSMKKEYWANESILFDWSGNKLHYYSMNVTRGVKPQVVKVTHQVLEEEFTADNLDDERKQKVVDTILASHAEKLLDHRIVSSVLLSGRGLSECNNWPKQDFVQIICNRRKVYSEPNLFARGAVLIGIDDMREHTAYPYTVICEGRIQASIMMEIMHGGVKKSLVLAQQGSCWYDIRTSVDLILDNTNSINLRIVQSEGKLVRLVGIQLDNFPQRPPRTTRVQLILNFDSENEAVVRVVDMGFGEMFPATKAVKKSRIMIQQ